jgi:type IV pilus assembly protein PilE
MRKRHNKGFTLIEVMIAVAIVAILASIAYPSYTEHVRKARRADGMSALLNAAHQLERCGSTFGRYDHAQCGGGNIAAVDSPEGYYSVAGVATASTYDFTATPQNEQVNDAGYCATFTLDESGVKGATGSLSADRCWNS